jgi:hypothetical protein
MSTLNAKPFIGHLEGLTLTNTQMLSTPKNHGSTVRAQHFGLRHFGPDFSGLEILGPTLRADTSGPDFSGFDFSAPVFII